MRTHNRKLVFDRITMMGPVSRAALARDLRLSATAVTDIVTGLLERDLVRESGIGESDGGRRPVLLEAHSETNCLLGLDLTADGVRALVSDPGGRVLARHGRAEPFGQGQAGVVTAIREAGRAALGLVGSGGSSGGMRPYAVGVAWSGPVAPDGSVTSPDIPGCEERPFPLRDELGGLFSAPVTVDNDANLGALAELRYGAGRTRRHLVYLLVHSGMGAGIVADGNLYRGHRHAAGEIGHTLFDPGGRRCECGNYGCLETVASTRALARYVAEGVRLGRPSELAEQVRADGPLDAETIIAAADRGDLAAQAAIEQIGEYLGVAAANIANAYAPELVVLGGVLVQAGDRLLDPLVAVARQRTLPPLRSEVDFGLSELGADGPPLGACAAAIDAQLMRDEAPGNGTRPGSAEEAAGV